VRQLAARPVPFLLPLRSTKLKISGPNLPEIPHHGGRSAKYDPGNAHPSPDVGATTGIGYTSPKSSTLPAAPVDSRKWWFVGVLARFKDCGRR